MGQVNETQVHMVGGVFRTSSREMMLAFCKHLRVTTSMAVEARALLFGLQIEKAHCYNKLHIEMDSLNLVRFLQDNIKCPWNTYYDIQRILSLLASIVYTMNQIKLFGMKKIKLHMG